MSFKFLALSFLVLSQSAFADIAFTLKPFTASFTVNHGDEGRVAAPEVFVQCTTTEGRIWPSVHGKSLEVKFAYEVTPVTSEVSRAVVTVATEQKFENPYNYGHDRKCFFNLNVNVEDFTRPLVQFKGKFPTAIMNYEFNGDKKLENRVKGLAQKELQVMYVRDLKPWPGGYYLWNLYVKEPQEKFPKRRNASFYGRTKFPVRGDENGPYRAK